ncbi:hypothetical protein [Reinekea sp. G2M2-21]|uniref:hypothetical protein n=1 Tax=Reinekea sp. G2M2-21 TaxID=2788942 RepID=UPI0018AC59FC|nr:hypothetical protein [Reinekea sp. G2M2-21]
MIKILSFSEFVAESFGVDDLSIYESHGEMETVLILEHHENSYGQYVVEEIETNFPSLKDYLAVSDECDVTITRPLEGAPMHGLADWVVKVETPYSISEYEISFSRPEEDAFFLTEEGGSSEAAQF